MTFHSRAVHRSERIRTAAMGIGLIAVMSLSTGCACQCPTPTGASAAPPVSTAQGPTPSAVPETKQTEPVQALAVCDRLEAKRPPTNPCDQAIAFDAPRGDGRRGANGLLVQGNWAAARGTQWSFEYTWAGTARGLQLVHPFGDGHIVVTCQKSVVLDAPGSWAAIGYQGKGKIRVETTAFAEVVFPLEHKRPYSFVSRLSADGSYALLINGKLVLTAHVDTAPPLNLVIPENVRPRMTSSWGELLFSGDGLPQTLRSWDAAIIIGPMDGGQNVARNVKLMPADVDALAAAE